MSSSVNRPPSSGPTTAARLSTIPNNAEGGEAFPRQEDRLGDGQDPGTITPANRPWTMRPTMSASPPARPEATDAAETGDADQEDALWP